MEKKTLKKLLNYVGIGLFFIMIIWLRAGFYTKDLPIILLILAVVAGLGIAARKIKTE